MVATLSPRPRPIKLLTDDPFLSPDWRWLQAGRIVDSGRRATPRIADSAIRAATSFRRAVARSRADDATHARLARRWPGLHAAHQIAEEGGPREWELQARLLAGQSDEEIGVAMELEPGVVTAYELTFFAMRERRDAWVWILLHAVGVGPGGPGTSADLGAIWRWFGFAGGPAVLDVVLAATHPHSERRQDLDLHLQELVERAITTMTTPAEDLSELVASVRRAHQDERLGDDELERLDLMVRSMELFLGGGQRGQKAREPAAPSSGATAAAEESRDDPLEAVPTMDG